MQKKEREFVARHMYLSRLKIIAIESGQRKIRLVEKFTGLFYKTNMVILKKLE